MITALITLMLVFLLFGVPIYVSMAFSGFLAVTFFSSINPMVMVQRFFGGMDAFALMALPFFILSANIMDAGGLSIRILKVARALVGHVSGGMGMTAQLGAMFFGSLSGSAPSTVAAVGKIMYPELKRSGYSTSFSTGLLASAGCVSLILPPSITLIIYAAVTGVSVSRLFMAGIGAGLVFGCVSLLYIYLYSRKLNLQVDDRKATRQELLSSIKAATWALMIPVIIMGGIYSGMFTPTEAAGVTAVYTMFVGLFIYREMSFKGLVTACKSTAITCGQILVMVAGAQALGWLLTIGQVPQAVTAAILNNVTSAILFLALLNVMLLIMGMFMEGIASIIIVAPLIFPVTGAFGIDPVHLGIIMISNLAIGMFTPPLGMNIFVMSSIAKCDMMDMLPGIGRFFLVNVVALLLITYIPAISLFLPNLLH